MARMSWQGAACLAVVAGLATSAQATVWVDGGVVRAEDGLPEWNQEIIERAQASPASATGFQHCRETAEVQGSFFCVGLHLKDINRAIARISIWAEGISDTPPHTVVKTNSQVYSNALSWILGNDVQSPDIIEFHQEMTQLCAQDKNYCLNAHEKEIWDAFILPRIESGEPFAIITYALKSMPFGSNWLDVASHELLHAQYFLQPAFRATVDAYWDDEGRVTATERTKISQKLNSIGYQTSTEPGKDFVLRNEFQAYVLMSGASSSHLKAYVPKHRQPLTDLLTQAGAAPIQVQGGDDEVRAHAAWGRM
jgi:hypothetical protein